MTLKWPLVTLAFFVSALHAVTAAHAAPVPLYGLPELRVLACRAGDAVGGLPPEAAALQVYRDPATGRFGAPPPQLVSVVPKALSTPARPLVERRVERPGGGVRLDLGDRFATALLVGRGADGELRTGCGLGPPDPTDEGEEPRRGDR
jgi:hypothetical protein